MRQGKLEQAIRTGHQGVQRQPDLVFSHYFLGAAYLVAGEHDPAACSSAAKHLLNATSTDARWGAAWLCLGQLALMCGEYEHADRFLRNGLAIEKHGPGFGYFIGFDLLLGMVADHRGDNEKARELYATSSASLGASDHVYREAFLALTACGLGDVLLREGRGETALAEFRRAYRLVKEYPRMLGRQRVLARTLAGMSAAHAATGDNPRARQQLDETTLLLDEIARTPQSWIWGASLGQLYYGVAAAFARVGEPERALDYLSRAVQADWRDVHWLSSDPGFSALHSLPAFQNVCDRLKALPAVDFNSSAACPA